MNVMSDGIEFIYSVNTIAYMYIQTNRAIYGYFFIIMKNHEIMLYLLPSLRSVGGRVR